MTRRRSTIDIFDLTPPSLVTDSCNPDLFALTSDCFPSRTLYRSSVFKKAAPSSRLTEEELSPCMISFPFLICRSSMLIYFLDPVVVTIIETGEPTEVEPVVVIVTETTKPTTTAEISSSTTSSDSETSIAASMIDYPVLPLEGHHYVCLFSHNRSILTNNPHHNHVKHAISYYFTELHTLHSSTIKKQSRSIHRTGRWRRNRSASSLRRPHSTTCTSPTTPSTKERKRQFTPSRPSHSQLYFC